MAAEIEAAGGKALALQCNVLKDEELAAMYDSTQEFILEFSRFIAYGISKR